MQDPNNEITNIWRRNRLSTKVYFLIFTVIILNEPQFIWGSLILCKNLYLYSVENLIAINKTNACNVHILTSESVCMLNGLLIETNISESVRFLVYVYSIFLL